MMLTADARDLVMRHRALVALGVLLFLIATVGLLAIAIAFGGDFAGSIGGTVQPKPPQGGSW